MSNARMGRTASATSHSDSTRTTQAKATTRTRKQQRTLKGWAPVPFNADRIALDLSMGRAR